jgi:hypothetical protein
VSSHSALNYSPPLEFGQGPGLTYDDLVILLACIVRIMGMVLLATPNILFVFGMKYTTFNLNHYGFIHFTGDNFPNQFTLV